MANKSEYYVIKRPDEKSDDLVLDVAQVSDGLVYIIGREAPFFLSEIHVISGPFSASYIRQKLEDK